MDYLSSDYVTCLVKAMNDDNDELMCTCAGLQIRCDATRPR